VVAPPLGCWGLRNCVPLRLHSAIDEIAIEREPADFYSGLRHCPLVTKQRFSLAEHWFKEA
jgi:hypothetical protein